MTLLAADIGNSTTVLGLMVDGEVVAHWQVSTDVRRTPDEWGLLLSGLLAESPRATGVAVCSAVPSVTRVWRSMLESGGAGLDGLPAVFVGPGVRSGIQVRMDNPREVGADRIANAVAVVERYGGPAIVVDFGLATTFDVVDATGAYVGGAITAGLEISSEALGRGGAQLRGFELVAPRSVIAKNTVEALQSGAIFGMAAQVDGVVARMIEELGAGNSTQVVATGSLAGLVIDHCRCFTGRDEWLTLRGLELIFARNDVTR